MVIRCHNYKDNCIILAFSSMNKVLKSIDVGFLSLHIAYAYAILCHFFEYNSSSFSQIMKSPRIKRHLACYKHIHHDSWLFPKYPYWRANLFATSKIKMLENHSHLKTERDASRVEITKNPCALIFNVHLIYYLLEASIKCFFFVLHSSQQ